MNIIGVYIVLYATLNIVFQSLVLIKTRSSANADKPARRV